MSIKISYCSTDLYNLWYNSPTLSSSFMLELEEQLQSLLSFKNELVEIIIEVV